MTYRKIGGSKDFVYTNEDLKRIEQEDTQSTKIFRKALRDFYKGKYNNKSKPEKREVRPKKKTTYVKKLIITLIIVLIVTLSTYFILNNTKVENNLIGYRNKTKYIPLNISFDEYLSNPENYHNQKVSLFGYLVKKYKDNTSSVFRRVLIDDFDNEIIITQISSEEIDYFVEDKTIKDVYEVIGIFRQDHGIPNIRADKITPSEKPTKEEIIQVAYYLKEPEEKLIKNRTNTDLSFRIKFYYNNTINFFKTKLGYFNEKFQGYINSDENKLEKFKKTINRKVDEMFTIEPISDKTSDVEKAILKYTNQERKNRGLSELKWNSKIAEIARDHSLDMVENNYFDHVNLNGDEPSDRARKAGFRQTKQLGGGWYIEGIGENIGMMPTGDVIGIGYVYNNADSIAEAQVKSWMNSLGHRSNILNPEYSDLGVGVAYDGFYYISTQNFW